ncbi:tetratricopeptide repeat protein [Candidatus Chloroploca sp. Khr17]|uniref:tetratricopeptide repeat protein n=1 Tax=Candidatus Chloroploca sp. Khr17 TaxID=2496869 RepID=UPI001F0D751B|nr:tetratricopeptide repeat protein [Candidatus Chloroploca sp. Khr17]
MAINNPKAQADVLIKRGHELLEQGDLPQATDLLNQAVKLYWAAGEQYAAAAQIGNYGWALRRRGRPDLARPYLEEAASLFAQLGLTDFAERHRFAAEDAHTGLTDDLLTSLPPAVRGALERGDVEGLQFALDALPLAERELILERLMTAGVVSTARNDDDVTEALRQFEPLLQGIAAVATGDERERADIEIALVELERKGWQLRQVVSQIWQGERNLSVLGQKLDELDQALVQKMLELIEPHRAG